MQRNHADKQLSLASLWEEIASAILGPQPDQRRIQFVSGIREKIAEDALKLVDRLLPSRQPPQE